MIMTHRPREEPRETDMVAMEETLVQYLYLIGNTFQALRLDFPVCNFQSFPERIQNA